MRRIIKIATLKLIKKILPKKSKKLNIISLYSRAAVLRGRVVTTSGRGLVGVRVTHADIHTEGYTMTQEDGWFDFMVNGGGAVTLTFGKSPFPPQVR